MSTAKHWVGWNDDVPIYVPEVDLTPTGVWYRSDGHTGINYFRTVFGDRKTGEEMIRQIRHTESFEMKPYIRSAGDVFISSLHRIKYITGVSFTADDEGFGKVRTRDMGDGVMLVPFQVFLGQGMTMGARRKVFKEMVQIIKEESSWNPSVSVYELSHDCRNGFLVYRQDDSPNWEKDEENE